MSGVLPLFTTYAHILRTLQLLGKGFFPLLGSARSRAEIAMAELSGFLALESPGWQDYELLDTGSGRKLERFGQHQLIRPEAQATWQPTLPKAAWTSSTATFIPSAEESGGHWKFNLAIEKEWRMSYRVQGAAAPVRFLARPTAGRHLGVFPETAAHWDFMARLLSDSTSSPRVLNLFGYTGLASLACAAVGAQVTHVDASKKSVDWARHNQALSGLDEKPIRWIVDDAMKYVQREVRRGQHYDGIIVEPPKFGRGPKGEVWEIYKSLPELMAECGKLIANKPLFFILTVYAVRASAIHMQQTLAELEHLQGGHLEYGELVSRESSAGRLLSHAVFARWGAK